MSRGHGVKVAIRANCVQNRLRDLHQGVSIEGGKQDICLRIIGAGATSVRVCFLGGTQRRDLVLREADIASPRAAITPYSSHLKDPGGRPVGSGATSVRVCSLRGTQHRDLVLREADITSPEVQVTGFSLCRLPGRPFGGGATSVKVCSIRGTQRRDLVLREAGITSTEVVTTAYHLFSIK
jgi:hypothetical protein